MKNKIGASTCLECEYPDCDVGLDRNEHPYAVCYSKLCGGEQYFTKGKPHKVKRLLDQGKYRPITGGPTADELRAKYGLELASPKPASSTGQDAPPEVASGSAPKKKSAWATVLDK